MLKKCGMFFLFLMIYINIFSIIENKDYDEDIIIPKHLEKGDTIGIIAPASYSKENAKYEIEYLINKGFKVVYGKSFYSKWYGFGGNDELRVQDINDMFRDDNIKAIFSIRGGYGTIRLVDKIDYNLIKKNPKIFLGYSDITTLLIAINEKTKLVTYHGPMSSNFKNIPEITEKSFEDVVINNKEINLLKYDDSYTIMKEGIGRGKITGGNLSLIVSTLGTEYEINTDNKILFLEETNEASYRIDRMLQQLKLAKKFDKLQGIIIGNFKNSARYDSDDMDIDEVFENNFKNLNIPIIKNFKSGHVRPFLTVPIGAIAKINTYNKEIIVEKLIN